MAARTRKGAAKTSHAPEGFEVLDNSKPEQLVLEDGEECIGILGPTFKSKDPEKPDYRTITVDGKRFYLPSHVGLLVLMEQPLGTRAWILKKGGVGTKKEPFEYEVAAQRKSAEAEDE